jgi:hypothetical protein
LNCGQCGRRCEYALNVFGDCIFRKCFCPSNWNWCVDNANGDQICCPPQTSCVFDIYGNVVACE